MAPFFRSQYGRYSRKILVVLLLVLLLVVYENTPSIFTVLLGNELHVHILYLFSSRSKVSTGQSLNENMKQASKCVLGQMRSSQQERT